MCFAASVREGYEVGAAAGLVLLATFALCKIMWSFWNLPFRLPLKLAFAPAKLQQLLDRRLPHPFLGLQSRLASGNGRFIKRHFEQLLFGHLDRRRQKEKLLFGRC